VLNRFHNSFTNSISDKPILINITMKKIITLFILTISTFVFSQTSTPNWYQELSKASEIAVAENKPMLLFFTGSDWCGWCNKLQREVFNTETFTTWSNECAILVEIDFPRDKPQPQNIIDQNNLLQQQFKVEGYPTVWFVDVVAIDSNYTIKPINKTGYLPGGPSRWIEVANSIIYSEK